jgi:hypothetical protein
MQPQAQYAQQMPVAGPPSISTPRGFFGALFDLSFSSFITSKLIKFLYILQIIGAGLFLMAGIGAGIMRIANDSVLEGLASIIVSPIIALVILIFGRLYLELVIVMFRIAEDIGDINKKTR